MSDPVIPPMTIIEAWVDTPADDLESRSSRIGAALIRACMEANTNGWRAFEVSITDLRQAMSVTTRDGIPHVSTGPADVIALRRTDHAY